MIDIYRHIVVGWMSAAVESAKLAEEWTRGINAAEGIFGGTLTIHVDRGTAVEALIWRRYADRVLAPGATEALSELLREIERAARPRHRPPLDESEG